MTRFCPSCWREVPSEAVCPACGADLRAWSRASYDEKLLRTLAQIEEASVQDRVAGER